MKKTKILIFFISTLFFLNIWLLFKIRTSNSIITELTGDIAELDQGSSEKEYLFRMFENDIELMLFSENIHINISGKIGKGNKQTMFDNIINGKPKLFLRYSELNCHTCVDIQFEALKELGKKIGNENIILLASYKGDGDLNRFMRINKINFKVFNIENSGLPVEKANTPFYFIADGSGFAKLVFVPRKEYPKLYKKYLEIVSQRFFQN
jgi:hypothetical protein